MDSLILLMKSSGNEYLILLAFSVWSDSWKIVCFGIRLFTASIYADLYKYSDLPTWNLKETRGKLLSREEINSVSPRRTQGHCWTFPLAERASALVPPSSPLRDGRTKDTKPSPKLVSCSKHQGSLDISYK